MKQNKTTIVILAFISLVLCCRNSLARGEDKDAYVSYKVCCEDSGAGVYSSEGFVFFIAEIDIVDKKIKRSYYEAQAMLEVKSMLKKYLIGDLVFPAKKSNPYQGRLYQEVADLVSSGNYVQLDIQSLRGRVLENFPRGDVYRYVFAVSEMQLNQLKNNISVDVQEYGFFVKQVFDAAMANNRNDELIELSLNEGLIEDALYYQKELLSERGINMVNYYHSDNPFLERKELRTVLAKRAEGNALGADQLKILPADYEVIQQIVSSEYAKDSLAASVLYLTSLPDTTDLQRKELLCHISTLMNNMQADCKGMKEYTDLLQEINEHAHKAFFQRNTVLKYTFLTLGHLEFSGFSCTENEYFEEAKELFTKGRNLDRIIDLLVKSIDQSPGYSEGWSYLAAALRANGMIEDALIVSTQSYQINKNIETLASMADCYHKLQKKNLARACAEHLVIMNRDVQSDEVRRVVERILPQLNNTKETVVE